jgi:tetratricopeptide (TPR) repeat protein
VSDAPAGDNSSPGDLHDELRTLRQAAEVAAGSEIKVKALARRLHMSASSVYAYFDGTTMPSAIVLDKILHELGASPADKRRLAGLREAADHRRRTQRKRGAGRASAVDIASPWQLPPDVRGFTGRTAELARLDALLTAREQFSAPTVALLSGTAGVGKTALVVHWAHRRRDEFPHGLLYMDLRGFDLEQPRAPDQVLGNFLRGLGVPRSDIPTDLAERTALFRDLLDRRKVLVLLDNAASEEQVRPLLPNSPCSLVIVTSRNSLNGLVARHGAHPVRVHRLPVPDAVSLLRFLIGDDRVHADKDGAAELVEGCSRLPLAIRIGAELASTRRRSGLSELAEELRRYHLDLFSAGGDERTAIRTVFSWSYLHLRADRARTFRLLGLHPGQDLDVYTCAALVDIDLLEARLRIDDLVRANLIEEAGNDRYRMHDLLRAYAREEAERCDPAEVEQAMLRLFDHYLHTSASALALIAPHDMISRAAVGPPASALPLANADHAMDWLDAERRNMLTMADVAANGDWPLLANQVSALLYRYLATRAHYGDGMALHMLALKVARNHGRRDLEGWELVRIGVIHLRRGHFVEALSHLTNALTIAEDGDDPVLECRALRHLGQVQLLTGHVEQAKELLSRALPQARVLDDVYTGGHVLSSLGVAHDRNAQYDEALACHYEAFMLANSLNDHDLQGHALINLGLHYAREDRTKAELCHERAVDIARKAGNPDLEANALVELGVVMAARGDSTSARDTWTNAMALAVGIGARHIEKRVHHLLAELPESE